MVLLSQRSLSVLDKETASYCIMQLSYLHEVTGVSTCQVLTPGHFGNGALYTIPKTWVRCVKWRISYNLASNKPMFLRQLGLIESLITFHQATTAILDHCNLRATEPCATVKMQKRTCQLAMKIRSKKLEVISRKRCFFVNTRTIASYY